MLKMNEFKILQGSDNDLPIIRDENTLYHTTDTKRTFVGSKELQNTTLDNYSASTLSGEDLIITSADTITEAFGKVETTILNDEEVITTTLFTIKNSVGLNENGEYNADTTDTILSAATSLNNADSKLSKEITSHESDSTSHITVSERNSWNNKATTAYVRNTAEALSGAIDTKQDKATTLSGYNIEDAYTITEVDNLFSQYSSDHEVIVKNMTESAVSISSNIFYVWGEMTELDITLVTPSDLTIYNEYMFQFTSGDTATTLSLPEGIVWYLGNNTILANKTYQVSIVNNLAVLGEF